MTSSQNNTQSNQSQPNKRRTTHTETKIKLKDSSKDPFNFNQTLATDTFTIDEDFLEKTQCTSISLGPEPIMQNCYVCPICNPKRNHLLCSYCYFNCHQQCRDIEGKNSDKVKEENNFLKIMEFSCYCGIRLKHRPDKPAKKELIACTMIQLDEALGVDVFYCENHQKTICCVCSVYCHKGCQITKRKEKDDEIVNCMCEGEKHTSYNEIAFTFPLQEYQNLAGVAVWPIQILNILFSNKNTFSKLSLLFTSIFNKKEIIDEMKENFYPLLELFSNTFNRKFKTFYYDQDILQMFPFENLIEYIQTLEITDPPTILLKFRLMFILLFIHLRKDFQMIKSLTSVDFLTNTILERLEYKKILTKKSIFNHLIDKKYNLENLFKEDNILKRIAMDQICNLMEIGMDYVCIEENQDEFEIGLKYLCFMLKRMIFTKGDIIKLINSLYKFHSKFFEYINSEKNNIYSLLDIFMGLAEIFYMITVSYNDIIVSEYLEATKEEKVEIEEITDFIHTKSDYGSLLFKMVLKSCDIMKKHYLLIQKYDYTEKSDKDKRKEKQIMMQKRALQEKITARTTGVQVKLPDNGGLFCEKIIKLFNETLRMFSLADNIYFKQLQSIKKYDLVEYFYFTKKINIDYFNNLDKKDGLAQFDSLYNLKLSIETKLNELFTNGYGGQCKNINAKIYDGILFFSNSMKEKFSMIENRTQRGDLDNEEIELNSLNKKEEDKKKAKSDKEDKDKVLMRQMSMQITSHQEPDTVVKKKKFTDFMKRVRDNNAGYFSFLKNDYFLKYKEDFVDCLIISNIDETLSKVLVFFSNRKYPNLLSVELLDIILSFLSLFFLTRRGMKYFLMGKNLSRLNKILNRYSCKANNKNVNDQYEKDQETNLRCTYLILTFLYTMVKGINSYELELKDHKVLLRFKKNLLEHIEQFNLMSNKPEYTEDFKEHCNLVLKILYFLSDDFELEDFEEIKKRIVLIFYESPLNLLDPSSFTSFYRGVVDTEKNNKSDINLNDSGIEGYIKKKNDGSDKKINTLRLKENNEKGSSFVSDDLQIEDKEEDEDKSNINPVEESGLTHKLGSKGNQSLYFSFFNIISKRTFYTFSSEEDVLILNSLYKFNDLKDYKILLETDQLTLKQRTILLKYCRTIYFLDRLDMYNILNQFRHLTTIEFKALIESNTIVEQNIGDYLTFKEVLDIPADKVKILQEKYNLINQINLVIQFFIGEVKAFPRQIMKANLHHIENYYFELIVGIKYIANFIYFEKEIWSKIILTFYQLTLEFLPKIEVFKRVYSEIRNTGTIITINIEPSETTQKILDRITATNFNIYNKKELYKYLSESIEEIFAETQLNKEICLSKYLEVFDTMAEANFTPFSLLETLDYEYFYEEESNELEKELAKDRTISVIKNIEDSFIKTFIDINNTNFLSVISTISNETVVVDYRQKVVDYFHSFLNSIDGNTSSKLEVLLCIITKMLFYDGDEMQGKFESLINDKFFFPNFNKLLNQNIVLSFSLTKNIFAFDRAARVTNLTKLIIQFLQSLGEGFNTTYHDNIFRFQKDVPIKDDEEEDDSEDDEENEEDVTTELNKNETETQKLRSKIKTTITTIPHIAIQKTIYESVIYNLKRVFYYLDMENLIDGEMPCDKLIIITTNFIDFLIEYIGTTEDKEDIIKTNMFNLFFGINKKKPKDIEDLEGGGNKDEMDIYTAIDFKPVIDIFTMKLKEDKKSNKRYTLRKKVICYVKMKYLQLIISYIQQGNKEKMVNKLCNSKCGPLELYAEILYNFREMLLNLQVKNETLYTSLMRIKNDDSYVQQLIDYYTYEKDVREMIELPLCLKLYILIKTYEEMYSQFSLRDHFEKMKVEGGFSDEDNGDKWGLRSKFSHRIHLFLEKIVLKVEIRNADEGDEGGDDGDDEEGIDENADKIVEKVIKKMNNDGSSQQTEEKKDDDDNEEEDDNPKKKKAGQNQITFFARPYLTFALSNHSRLKFEENVDRTNATSKFVELVSYSDYCLFEMVVNHHTIGKSKFFHTMAEINFYYLEIFNYLIIIAQNILVMRHFYRSPDLPSSEYDVVNEDMVYHLFNDNLFLAFAQTGFLAIALFIWYYFKFPNTYQLNLMKIYNRNFIFRKKGDKNKISQKIVDFFQEDEDADDEDKVGVVAVLGELNKDISNWKLLYVSVVESMLLNREMNILLVTLILNILYFVTQSSMFLVIPTLFIANIIPTLFDIFKAMKMKFGNMITVLLFDYLLVYLFMWVTYFYMPDLFSFDDILEPSSEATISESFCYSSLQCFLFMVQQGVRAGGGIGDIIDKVSYQSDMGFFLFRFFYDMIFFIIIILVLGNVFLGIIVDTFAELRDENTGKENDKKNICFICQLSRDACLTRNIDFNKHVANEHFLWNYVYFLTYLHVNNPNDFNRIENSVWSRLEEQDFGWIPIENTGDD